MKTLARPSHLALPLLLLPPLLAPLATHAALMEFTIEGVMLEREGGRSYGGGYTVLDLFQPGDPFSIKLQIDSSSMLPSSVPPGATSAAFASSQIPTVVDASLTAATIPHTFSLLGGPTYLPGFSECFDGPGCINSLTPYGASAFNVTSVVDDDVSVDKSLGANNQFAFDWSYYAQFDAALHLGIPPGDPHQLPGALVTTLGFSFEDIGAASFNDLAFGAPFSYDGSGSDSGLLTILQSPNFDASGKDVWRFNYSFDITSVTFSPVAAVPEAETWAMMMVAAGVLGWRLRQRNAAV